MYISISVFIPVYNEEKTIDLSLYYLSNVLKDITDDYEILIINDGSTDKSREKVLEWIKKDSRICLIEHKTNLGYGSALKTGFNSAKKNIVFYTDADMPIDFNDIKKVLPLIEIYDLIIGYRINREDNNLRRFLFSKIYNYLMSLLLNVKVRDVNFSFKLIRRESLNKIKLSAKSVFIDGELLAEAVRHNLSIKEVPIIYMPRRFGVSNFDTLSSAFITLKEMIIYCLKRKYRSL